MSSPYVKGRAFEHYVKRKLEAKEWIVIRSRGSRGVFDLIAVRNGEIMLIQCKWRKPIKEGEKEDLLVKALKAGGIPVLATHINGRVKFIDIRNGEQIKI
jgi:Holliday junction resolvase